MNNVIDLSQNYFERTVGDLTVRGIWIPCPDQYEGATEPALAITAANRASRPFIIALSSAFKYENPAYMARITKEIAEFIGMGNVGVFGLVRIAYLINDHLSDLISMPPQPTKNVLAAEGSMRIQGRSQGVKIYDRVAEVI